MPCFTCGISFSFFSFWILSTHCILARTGSCEERFSPGVSACCCQGGAGRGGSGRVGWGGTIRTYEYQKDFLSFYGCSVCQRLKLRSPVSPPRVKAFNVSTRTCRRRLRRGFSGRKGRFGLKAAKSAESQLGRSACSVLCTSSGTSFGLLFVFFA